VWRTVDGRARLVQRGSLRNRYAPGHASVRPGRTSPDSHHIRWLPHTTKGLARRIAVSAFAVAGAGYSPRLRPPRLRRAPRRSSQSPHMRVRPRACRCPPPSTAGGRRLGQSAPTEPPAHGGPYRAGARRVAHCQPCVPRATQSRPHALHGRHALLRLRRRRALRDELRTRDQGEPSCGPQRRWPTWSYPGRMLLAPLGR
jgi:hypothetical protein